MTDFEMLLARLNVLIELQGEQNELLKALVKPKRAKKRAPVPTKNAWTAYKWAFRRRYNVFPQQSAKSNALMSQIVKELGTDAPNVLYFYLSDESHFVCQRMHSLGVLKSQLEEYTNKWRKCREETGKDVMGGSIFNLDYAIRACDTWHLLDEAMREGSEHAGETHVLPEISGPGGVKFGTQRTHCVPGE